MEPAISAFDIQRMLIGDEPPLFLLEIVFRTLVIYAYSLVLIRWLGGRAIGQLSLVEVLLIIALGSAVGDAMFYPDVPLAHALLVITTVVFANKGLDFLMDRSERVEDFIDGHPMIAVRDGVVDAGFLASGSLSRDELFQELRKQGVRNLMEVDRAYLERDGTVTVFKTETNGASGLRIEPPLEVTAPRLIDVGDQSADAVCINCGHSAPQSGPTDCENCGCSEWTMGASANVSIEGTLRDRNTSAGRQSDDLSLS